ncbi:polysaccharide deacetylase [Prolixibacteraceae bacterium JC049]|nr:polysaccharide deacetylase [Prolixibacteraceae bacterium JC049]
MNKFLLSLALMLLSHFTWAQVNVAITIDDVPSTKKFQRNHFQPKFLNQLDSLNIPVAIFINERNIYSTDSVTRNFDLLNQWISKSYTTLGNHTFSHARYSASELEDFTADITKGESITRELAKKYKKALKYFRFPYNDLGKDSLQQHQITTILKQKNYISTPFTIESSDWVFNYLYEYYIGQNNIIEAQRIGQAYVNTTLAYFKYFSQLAEKQYGRSIDQIYLCHDNSINADYLSIIVQKLKEKNYSFVSLDKAMQDKVYQQKNNFYKKWGISWFYRWMTDNGEIKRCMNNEPDIMPIYKEYQQVQNKKQKK